MIGSQAVYDPRLASRIEAKKRALLGLTNCSIDFGSKSPCEERNRLENIPINEIVNRPKSCLGKTLKLNHLGIYGCSKKILRPLTTKIKCLSCGKVKKSRNVLMQSTFDTAAESGNKIFITKKQRRKRKISLLDTVNK